MAAAAAPVPAADAEWLSAAAARIARDNLRLAAESSRLLQAFDTAGIDLLFLKGLALGKLAYGNILIKSGWDVDILVSSDDLATAGKRLASLGYDLVVPGGGADSQRLAAWHRRSKESVWSNRERGFHVELHTGLVDNKMLLPGTGLSSPRQAVEIAAGIVLPTLAGDALFAYLCVHGASSAWFRLKWLADLAALIAGCDDVEIERLYRRSQELGAGRAAGSALILCAEMLGTAVPGDLLRSLRRDRGIRLLVAAARASMTGRAIATELSKLTAGTLWIHLSQFGLLPGLRYKWAELRHQAGLVRRFLPPAG